MSDESKTITMVEASWNQNNTILVTFNPQENSWEFPKNNKLKLFNMIHWILSEAERKCVVHVDDEAIHYPVVEYKNTVIHKAVADIQDTLAKWIECGELLIRK